MNVKVLSNNIINTPSHLTIHEIITCFVIQLLIFETLFWKTSGLIHLKTLSKDSLILTSFPALFQPRSHFNFIHLFILLVLCFCLLQLRAS